MQYIESVHVRQDSQVHDKMLPSDGALWAESFNECCDRMGVDL